MEEISGVQICIVAVALVLTLGLITCVINHYNKMGGRSWSGDQRRHNSSRKPKTSTATRALYSPAQKAARKEELFQEHQLQMLSVQRDLAYNYPPTVCRPDLPECRNVDPRTYEVPKSYIRPPPNRIVCGVGKVCPSGSCGSRLLHKQRTHSLNHTARHDLVTHTSLLPASTRSSHNDYALDRWQPPGGGQCSLDLFADPKEIDTDDLPPKYEDVVHNKPHSSGVQEVRDVQGH